MRLRPETCQTRTKIREAYRKIKMGIAEATFPRWNKVYAGLCLVAIRRLNLLKDENGVPMRLVADLTLDQTAPRGAAGCDLNLRKYSRSGRVCRARRCVHAAFVDLPCQRR